MPLIFVMLLLYGCQESDLLAPDSQISQVTVDVHGLPDLGGKAWYECWIYYEEGENVLYKSLGLLDVDGNGQATNTYAMNMGFLQRAKYVIISIEPDQHAGNLYPFINKYTIKDADWAETGSEKEAYYAVEMPYWEVFSAKLAANLGNLSIIEEYLLGYDFTDAEGTFVLATPSDADGTNPTSGVWFMMADTTQGLELPALPASKSITTQFSRIDDITTVTYDSINEIVIENTGKVISAPKLMPGSFTYTYTWVYESFVLFGNDSISLGKFSSPDRPDKSDIYKGAGSGWPFPGGDLLTNAPAGFTFPTDLSGKKVIVGLHLDEPVISGNYMSNVNDFPVQTQSVAPFDSTVVYPLVVPFSADIPQQAAPMEEYALDNNSEALTAGTTQIATTIYQ